MVSRFVVVVLGAFALSCLSQDIPALKFTVYFDGKYSFSVGGSNWLESTEEPTVCVDGTSVSLVFDKIGNVDGNDNFGSWEGVEVTWKTNTPEPKSVIQTFKSYPSLANVAVLTSSFPDGLSTAQCGSKTQQSTRFPTFDVAAFQAETLSFLTWRGGVLSDTAITKGLGALNAGSSPFQLDSGPVVSFDSSGNSVVWSTLDSHKIVLQSTTGSTATVPLTALWDAKRRDQLTCLSQVCFADQTSDYVNQRVEGYGFTAGDANSPLTHVTIGGRAYKTKQLFFAWSVTHADNWVGSNSSSPDASYDFRSENGYILAEQAPGSLPLLVYSKVYDASHTDYATIASSSGKSWAKNNGYTFQYVTGYVLTTPSGPTSSGQYAMGLSAGIPVIPADWSYSVVFVASTGGPTAATYAWGQAMQSYYHTKRLPSVTLSDIGYYTDDGAYYYVWEAFGIPARPWPAQTGLVLVKERLWAQGVPVAYMQLDDCKSSLDFVIRS